MKKISLLFVAAIFILASCSKKDKTGLLVPKDAGVVVHINTASLTGKLSWDEISKSEWFKEVYSQAMKEDTMAAALFNDPEKSGVDTKGGFVFFTKNEGRGGYAVFEGKIKDAAAFETLNRKYAKEKAPEKDGEFTVAAIENDQLVAWNAEHFAYIFNYNSPRTYVGGYRSSRFSTDSLRILVKDVLKLSGDKLLGTDDRFAELVNNNADIHFWMNTSEYYETGEGMMGVLSMMRMNVLLEKNVAATSINFENGKIVADSKQYYGDEVTNLLKKYKADGVDAATVNKLPANSIAALAMNYPPEGLKAFLKLIGADGISNGFLKKNNYSIDEFIKANKGTMLFALTGVDEKEVTDTFSIDESDKTSTYTHTRTNPQFLFANAVNDKPSFEKLMNILDADAGGMAKNEIPGLQYKLQDNWFVAGNVMSDIDGFYKGGNKVAFADKVSGHTAGGFADLQKIFDLGLAKNKDSIEQKSIQLAKQTWKDAWFNGGDFKDGSMQSHFEITMMDANTNSLKQLNKFADEMYAINKNKMRNFDEENVRTDSIPPVQIDTVVAPKVK